MPKNFPTSRIRDTPEICLAAMAGDVAEIRRLVTEENADIHATDGFGRSALLLAVKSGNLACLRLLIHFGGDIHEGGSLRAEPPLIAAVRAGSVPCAELLLRSGCDANQTHTKGRTPLIFSVYNDNLELTLLLLEYNADANKRSADGAGPLSVAASKGVLLCAHALLDFGADPLLMGAHEKNAIEIVKTKISQIDKANALGAEHEIKRYRRVGELLVRYERQKARATFGEMFLVGSSVVSPRTNAAPPARAKTPTPTTTTTAATTSAFDASFDDFNPRAAQSNATSGDTQGTLFATPQQQQPSTLLDFGGAPQQPQQQQRPFF